MKEHDCILEFIDEAVPLGIKPKNKRLIVSQTIFFNLIKEAQENFGFRAYDIKQVATYNFNGYEIVNGYCENPIYQL